MDPNLVITICFCLEVLLFALVFTLYVVHEVHRARARSATPPESGSRQRGIR
jgi:hypothetical protein